MINNFYSTIVEVVGLNSHENGRSCSAHPVCGKELRLNEMFYFESSRVEIDGRTEMAIAVKKVNQGIVSCTVGFLPKEYIHHITFYVGKFGQMHLKRIQKQQRPMRSSVGNVRTPDLINP